MLQFPPNSPNLNPLDYFLWGAVDGKLKAKYDSIPALQAAIIAELAAMKQESINKAIEQFKRRCVVCVEQDGGNFELAEVRSHHMWHHECDTNSFNLYGVLMPSLCCLTLMATFLRDKCRWWVLCLHLVAKFLRDKCLWWVLCLHLPLVVGAVPTS